MQPTGSARIERRLAVIFAADRPIARHGRGSGAGASAKGGKAAPDCDIAGFGSVETLATRPAGATISRFTGRADSSS
jgi:hypothetical protein